MSTTAMEWTVVQPRPISRPWLQATRSRLPSGFEGAPVTTVVVPRGTTVAQLATGLNRLGVRPRDLVSIFQALSRMGALRGRLELM